MDDYISGIDLGRCCDDLFGVGCDVWLDHTGGVASDRGNERGTLSVGSEVEKVQNFLRPHFDPALPRRVKILSDPYFSSSVRSPNLCRADLKLVIRLPSPQRHRGFRCRGRERPFSGLAGGHRKVSE